MNRATQATTTSSSAIPNHRRATPRPPRKTTKIDTEIDPVQVQRAEAASDLLVAAADRDVSVDGQMPEHQPAPTHASGATLTLHLVRSDDQREVVLELQHRAQQGRVLTAGVQHVDLRNIDYARDVAGSNPKAICSQVETSGPDNRAK